MTASEVTWEWSDETVAAPRGATRRRWMVPSDSGDSTRGDTEVRGGSPMVAQQWNELDRGREKIVVARRHGVEPVPRAEQRAETAETR